MSDVINLLILVLLAAVMVYGVMLTRRVNRLMQALTELGPLVRQFSEAVDKSEQSVQEMKGAAVAAAEGAAREADALRDAMAGATFTSIRRQPVAGMTRLSDKADLVKSFFDRSRRQNEAAKQW